MGQGGKLWVTAFNGETTAQHNFKWHELVLNFNLL